MKKVFGLLFIVMLICFFAPVQVFAEGDETEITGDFVPSGIGEDTQETNEVKDGSNSRPASDVKTEQSTNGKTGDETELSTKDNTESNKKEEKNTSSNNNDTASDNKNNNDTTSDHKNNNDTTSNSNNNNAVNSSKQNEQSAGNSENNTNNENSKNNKNNKNNDGLAKAEENELELGADNEVTDNKQTAKTTGKDSIASVSNTETEPEENSHHIPVIIACLVIVIFGFVGYIMFKRKKNG